MSGDKIKIRIEIVVYENEGKQGVKYAIDENHLTMNNVALALLKLKHIEQMLIDKEFDPEGENGYEIIKDGKENEP